MTDKTAIIMQVDEILDGVVYPTSKQNLIEHSEMRGASIDFLDTLDAIDDKEYRAFSEVLDAIASVE